MLNPITNTLRRLGILRPAPTETQIRRQRCANLAWRIMAVQMNELYAGTGYPEPFKVVGRELG